MTLFEMAKMYYPKLWGEKRIRALFAADKLTYAEMMEILDNKD